MPGALPADAGRYDATIASAAVQYNVPAALIKAIIWRESDFNPRATASASGDLARGGAYGLMQMTLLTARGLGYTGPIGDPDALSGLFSPTANIDLGTRYLAQLLQATGGQIDAAISAYNAGLSSERAGDGKRVTNDPSSPFINQPYVDWVREAISRLSAAQLAGAGGILLIAALAGVAVFSGRR